MTSLSTSTPSQSKMSNSRRGVARRSFGTIKPRSANSVANRLADAGRTACDEGGLPEQVENPVEGEVHESIADVAFERRLGALFVKALERARDFLRKRIGLRQLIAE